MLLPARLASIAMELRERLSARKRGLYDPCDEVLQAKIEGICCSERTSSWVQYCLGMDDGWIPGNDVMPVPREQTDLLRVLELPSTRSLER